MNSSRKFTTSSGTELPITLLKGKEYLQVVYRIQWFREEHPDWSITTKCEVNFEKKTCLAFCEIRDQQGKVLATAHKFEFSGSFAFFVEKAETGSIGRALALCGYGTQFTNDFDEDDDPNASLSDAPIDPQKTQVHKTEQVLAAETRPQWNKEQKKEYCIKRWNISDGSALSAEQKVELSKVASTATFESAMINLAGVK